MVVSCKSFPPPPPHLEQTRAVGHYSLESRVDKVEKIYNVPTTPPKNIGSYAFFIFLKSTGARSSSVLNVW